MILVNGDSWTGGPTYPNQQDHWPYKLNQPVINLAHGGVSNQYIFRTTIEFLYTDHRPITHVIIGWTLLERFELPHVSDRYIRITPWGITTFISPDNEHVPSMPFIRDFYYQHLHSIKLQYQTFLYNLRILQDLCRIRNVSLLCFNSIGPKSQLLEESSYCSDSWILPPNTTMDLWCDHRGHARTASRHTTVQGQSDWAQLVQSHISRKSP